MDTSRLLRVAAAAAIVPLVLVACGDDTESENGNAAAANNGGDDNGDGTAAENGGDQPTEVTIEDNNGSHTISLPVESIVATDNRTFETLYDWGIELEAGAVSLMPDTIGYVNDDSIIDLGAHREPNLELVVAVDPDLVINGQRYVSFFDDMVRYAPNAVVLDLDPRDGEPFADELKRQVSVLGDVFGKQTEAEALVSDFDASIERVIEAYDDGDTVMAVITSGGNIGYVVPGTGRTLGPLFDIFSFTPALEIEGSTDHQGDDISVEAIAAANPDWILVLDRDASVAADDPEYVPAAEVLENSEALTNVTAIQEGNIVYMPADTYTNEGIQTYTEYFNTLADAFEAAR